MTFGVLTAKMGLAGSAFLSAALALRHSRKARREECCAGSVATTLLASAFREIPLMPADSGKSQKMTLLPRFLEVVSLSHSYPRSGGIPRFDRNFGR